MFPCNALTLRALLYKIKKKRPMGGSDAHIPLVYAPGIKYTAGEGLYLYDLVLYKYIIYAVSE